MTNKSKPLVKNIHKKMYSPPFIPHDKELCKPMKKKQGEDIKNLKKNLFPSRNN